MSGGFSAPIMTSFGERIRTKFVYTTSFIFVRLIGGLLSLEILIDRLVTKLPSMKKVSPSTAIPIKVIY